MIARPSALIIRARSWKVSLRSAGPPTSRAWRSIAAEIEPARAGHRHRRAVDRARDLGKVAVAGDPAVAFVIQELESFHARPLEEVRAQAGEGR